MRVVVADDHPLWRETLTDLLEHGGTCTVVAAVGDGQAVVTACAALEPDVVVMDVSLPNLDGIEATREIVAAHACRVLVLSGVTDAGQVLAAVQAGASGYLAKTAGGPEIRQAVARVHAGETVLSFELGSALLSQLGPRPGRARIAIDTLTTREREVLTLMAEGRSNPAIAGLLSVSPKTVEAHIAAIFSKLGLDNTAHDHRRVQAVLAFLAHNSGDRP